MAAARSIDNLARGHVIDALALCPEFKLVVVGHSLGAGTAALLSLL